MIPKIFDMEVPKGFDGLCYLRCEQNEYWYKNGLIHRIGGPAIIHYGYCGSIITTPVFYIEGKPYSEIEYWYHPLVLRNSLNEALIDLY